MPICKFCAMPMQWGRSDEKWVPLVPLGEEGDLDRTHQDSDGNLRAEHRLICIGWTPAVSVVKLAKPIPASDIVQVPPPIDHAPRRRRKKT